MRDNGTDRDVALLILDGLTTCASLVESVNDNLYVPHIITQPVSVEADLGDTITFTVVANNVKSYQWQYKQSAGATTWRNSSYDGNNTATLTFELIEARVGYRFRCVMIGNDNSEITTNTVAVTQAPAPEPEG